jgi:CPA2 family monovalent cation:H+ antiporter-2
VLVGYGRVGKRIAAELTAVGIPFVVAEENREAVEQLRAQGIPAVFGNATEPAVLIQAHVATARMLVIATPEAIEVAQMARTARTLNPAIEIAIRSHNAQEADLLANEWQARVFVGERELADAMVAHVLRQVAPTAPPA